MGGPNATAQLDSAIKSFKRSVSLQKGKDPQLQWANHLQEGIHGERKVPRNHMLRANSAESDRFGSGAARFQEANLGFALESMAAYRRAHSDKKISDRGAKRK